MCGAIFAAGLHILFRFMDYDHYSLGIDAENTAQYNRAQAAYRDGVVPGHPGHLGHHGHHDVVTHPNGVHNGTVAAPVAGGGVLPR